MLQNLDIQLQTLENQTFLLRLRGDLDMFTCAELKDVLHQCLPPENYSVLLDLDKVHYIDSMGLGTLLGAVNAAQHRHGQVEVVCNQPHLLKLFHVTGVHRVMLTHPTEQEGLAHLQQGLAQAR